MIIEKKLGISPDYQYRALRMGFWPKANWHKNKLFAINWTGIIDKRLKVLDLGTGSGNFELEFAPLVKRIVGVDYNADAISFLKQKLVENVIKNVDLIYQDIRKLDLKQLGKYDLLVMIDVIEHISINDGKLLIKKLYKLLKPGGKVIIITPNYKPMWIVIETILDKISAVPKLAGEQHLAKYEPESISRLFNKNGFKVEKITTFNIFSWFFPTQFLSRLACKFELDSSWSWGSLLMGVFTKF